MEMERQEKSSLLKEDETTPIYGQKYRKDNSKLLLLALTAALICFVIATIVLAVLLGMKEDETSETTACSSACTSQTCLEATSFLMQGLNTSVSPCEDFYKYSCGNWEANNVIPEGFGRYSTFSELGTGNSITLKKALEVPVPEGDDGSVSKARYMYQRCMDLEAISSEGPQPLKNIIILNGGWALINQSEPQPWSLEDNLYLEHYYGSNAFFSFGLDADDFDSNKIIIKVLRISMMLFLCCVHYLTGVFVL